MTYVMGIDGGGSTVRVVITTPDLEVRAEYIGPTVNPNVVGRDEAARRIQAAMHETINQSGLAPEQIEGVSIGVAGAADRYDWSSAWLTQVVAGVVPQTNIIPSSDYEIALVGAHGQRLGILLLSGTGSFAYGVNASGESTLVGGWGYLIGDEGSGYWLGEQALRAVVRMADGRGRRTALYDAVISELNLKQPLDLIMWLYGQDANRVREVARLAPLVLHCAAQGDSVAQTMVTTGARDLALSVRSVAQRLELRPQQVVFAGGLLTTSNPLSDLVCELLGLSAIPAPKHTPVMGAAILALGGVRC
jgi:N-acetylglucosamine kinase-like BadF-type ATPase